MFLARSIVSVLDQSLVTAHLRHTTGQSKRVLHSNRYILYSRQMLWTYTHYIQDDLFIMENVFYFETVVRN